MSDASVQARRDHNYEETVIHGGSMKGRGALETGSRNTWISMLMSLNLNHLMTSSVT